MKEKVPVFVVSLLSSVQRRERLAKHFADMGIAFEWLDAVNGGDLSKEEMSRLCDMTEVESKPHWLTRGAIGCALSHYRIYELIIERGLPYALVFEDDVLLSADFKTCLEHTIPLLSGNQIISFYYQSWTPVKLQGRTRKHISGKYFAYLPEDISQPLNAAAYLITREAAISMTKNILPVRLAADAWGAFSEIGAFDEFRCVYPRPVDVVDAKSSINYLGNDWKARLLKWVDRNKVFPVYQILRHRRKSSRMKMMKVKIV